MKGKKVVVQGLGNVGLHSARFCHANGAKIISVIEYNGAIHNENGIDPQAAFNHFKVKGTLEGFEKCKFIKDGRQALEIPCDVLIPAALEGELNRLNAARINTKIIVEGANGPTTPAAAEILESKGVFVVPDLLANAGGVTVSYFEWLKNLSHMRFGRMTKRYEEAKWASLVDSLEKSEGKKMIDMDRKKITEGAGEEDLVNSGLEETMITSFKEVWDKSIEKKCNMRTAAYLCAIEKVANTYVDLGI